ncbi:hypothetical protein BKA70DRAFT_1279062 [Coprinopsis sp. MPI-PUGE-AT-0042]|nr:hypothetical protein BKA70DRAFT_1279062 [Coprinopsis sp. MPI-PUGE-AT-0042]
MSLTLDIDPRLHLYTNSNDPLPSKLKPVLDTHLDALRNRVSACDALIIEMEARILDRRCEIWDTEGEIEDIWMGLRRQREAKDALNTAIQTLEATASAVRRLPPEIVALIISFTVLEGWADFREQCLRNACAVSKLWRSTALSTPSFWRLLYFNLDRFSSGRSRDQAKWLP